MVLSSVQAAASEAVCCSERSGAAALQLWRHPGHGTCFAQSFSAGRGCDIGVRSDAPRTVCGHSKRELQPNRSFLLPVAAVPDWPSPDFSDEFFFPLLNFSLWFEREEDGTDF